MRTEFTYPSKDGKTQIHAVERVPEDVEPRAVIQLTHGMVEYISRYTAFADFLESEGFIVVGNDHLGHGHSVTSDSELGFFNDSHPSWTLVRDMHTLRTMTQMKYPNLPYFMFGHSMGSYLLRQYLTRYANGISGAIICGTGYEKQATVRFGLAYIKLLTKLHGSHYRSTKIQKMTFGKAYNRYDLTGQDLSNTWLSKNEENVAKYYKDPWCTYTFTLNGYRGLLESVGYVCLPSNIDKMPKDLPILIISGADDPVGNLGQGVREVDRLFREAGMTDVTMHLYEGDRHEILNEPDHEKVYTDIMVFLNGHMH